MSAGRIPATVVRTGTGEWRSGQLPGVSVQVLRYDKVTRESSLLLRLDAGARVPAHDHPGGEELYVLEGDFQVGPEKLGAGDYLYTPPDGIHAASSQGGCLVLVVLPEPVRILAD